MTISALTSGSQNYASQMFAKVDTDSSGGISKEEFTTSRSNEVTEEMASSLYDELDTSGSGSLTIEDLASIQPQSRSNMSSEMSQEFLSMQSEDSKMTMNVQGSGRPPPPPPPSSSETSETDDDEDLASIISSMDSDEDGIISQEEFLAARPEGVSEEMATTLWGQMDTEGAGEMSTDSLQESMAQNRLPPQPPQGERASDSSEESTLQALIDELSESTSATTNSLASTLLEFQTAVKSYETSFSSDSNDQLTASLMAAI